MEGYTGIIIALISAAIATYFIFFSAPDPKAAAPASTAAAAPAAPAAAAAPAALAAAAAPDVPAAAAPAPAPAAAPAPTPAAAPAPAPAAAPAPAPKKAPAAGELGQLLLTRPNKPGEPATQLLLTHRAGQVDFKLAVVRCVDGAYEYFDTMQDPETTGNFRLAVDGSTLDVFATAPRKWVKKFVKEADGSWKCTSPDFPGTTAVASDISPAPSKLGAGGLPKGQVNLGEQDEDVRAGLARSRSSPTSPPLTTHAHPL